jgi:4-amino-4-deoxy-L-arabinose transferase-like glycosyltransferase
MPYSLRSNGFVASRVSQRAWTWITLIGVLLVAFFLRFHRLDQLPPVASYDEAYNGIEAERILRADYHPLFFETNGGRMPLFIYQLAGAVAAFGANPWALRLVSVVWGLLAIPCVYQLGRELYKDEGEAARPVGILAAACVAVLLWQVQPSRVAIPSMQLLPASMAAVGFFWRAWSGRGYKFFCLSGIALGVTLYTHLAGRMVPLVLACFVAVQVLVNWRRVKFSPGAWVSDRRVIGCLLTAMLAALVFAPMIVYFLTNPGALTLRSEDIYIFGPVGQRLGPPLKVLADNVVTVLRMFVDRGDMNEWYNLPGRPALDPLMQVGFLIGLALALVRFKRSRSWLLLMWIGVMLIPTILSIEAPHFTRSAGAIVPVALLVAAGLAWGWARLSRGLHYSPANSWPILVAALTLVSGSLTYDAYFNRWAKLPILERGYREPEYAMAQRALELSRTGDVALPLEVFIRPSARFILENTFSKVAPLAEWPGGRPVAVVAPTKPADDALVVLHRTSPQSGVAYITEMLDETARQQFQQMADSGPVIDQIGQVVGRVIPDAGNSVATLLRPRQTLEANIDNLVQLTGYSLWPASTKPGDTVHLTLYWNCLRSISRNYFVFVHLVDASGNVVAQLDNPPLRGTYPTSLWSPGEVVPDGYDLHLPKNLPTGKYRFEVGWYSQVIKMNDRLPVLSVQGQTVNDNRVLLGVVTIPETLSDPQNRLEVTAGQPPLISLAGYDLDTLVVKAGGSLNLTLYWEALRSMDLDYTVFIHLRDKDGQIVAQEDVQPQNGRAPTSLWAIGETVIDRHQIGLGADAPPGPYRLYVGVYYWGTGERLPLEERPSGRLPDDTLVLPVSISVER